ncbi:MAG: TRAM domain-containing protein [Acidobacteriota bacterium]
MVIYIYKIIFIAIFGFIGFRYPPFPGTDNFQGAIIGGAFALALILVSLKVKKTEFKYLWGVTLGILGGAFVGWAMLEVFKLVTLSFSAYIFFKLLFLIGFPITGFFIGVHKPNLFAPSSIKEFFRGSSASTDSFLLDTSAIIDGRIIQIIESGFIQGEVIITHFVLAELQMIADSNDPNKKVRGKRGVDVIEKMQNNNQLKVTILNKAVTGAKEVDQKLILLAKDQNFKLITNDINLSKIAKLQNVTILNVNELAFALKPIVFPGERLKVHISKDGKEKKQGIAYLEDGTMIVVDDAKSDIGLNKEIEVTSVLQTTSGKMIFGKKIN